MKWAGYFLLVLAVFLSSCGGGGSAGGGGAQLEPSVTLNNLYGADKALPREGFLIFDVSNLTLEQDEYIGLVDGYFEVTLLRLEDGSLGAILPFDFPAGEHVLTLTVGDEQFEIPFETLASEVAPRNESLTELDLTFAELRAVLDEAIALKTSQGAPQDEIDELIGHREALHTDNPDFALGTDAELDYLNKMLLLLLEQGEQEAVAASRSLRSFSPQCDSALKSYKRKLKMTLLATAVGTLALVEYGAITTTGVGLAIGAAFSAAVLLQAKWVADAWITSWDACVDPLIDRLLTKLGLSSAGRAKRSIPIQDGGQDFIFVVEIPYQYSLATDFDVPDTFGSTFASLRKIVSDFAFVIEDTVESFIFDRTGSESYVETPPSSLISVEAVDHPGISVDVTPVDEESFTLTFRASPGVDRETEFSFVLYNQEHQLKTRFGATLEVPEHCPIAYAFDAVVIAETGRCLVVEANTYHVYRFGQPLLSESFGDGNFSLSAMKGLQAYPQLDDIRVSQFPLFRTEFTDPIAINSEYWQTVVASDTEYFPDGSVRSLTTYTAPFAAGAGYTSVPSQQRQYYESGVMALSRQFSAPLRVDDANWQSVPLSEEWYSESGQLSGSASYSSPQQNIDGSWTSVAAVTDYYYASGSLSERREMSAPLQRADGGWTSVTVKWSRNDLSGDLLSEHIYHSPTQTSDGTWVAATASWREYNEGALFREHLYSQPLWSDDGSVMSVLEVKRQFFEDGETEYFAEFYQVPPSPGPDGYWSSVLKTRFSYHPNGEPWEELEYSNALQADDGTWVYVDVSRKTYYDTGVLAFEGDFYPPVKLSDGYWIAYPAWGKSYYSSGALSEHHEHHLPVQVTVGEWSHGMSRWRVYYESGELEWDRLYSEPLKFQSFSGWQTVLSERKRYFSSGGLAEWNRYSEPLETDAGDWQSIYQLTETFGVDGTRSSRIEYSEPFMTSEAGWISTFSLASYYDAAGLLNTRQHYTLPPNSYMNRTDRYNAGVLICYDTYNQNGDNTGGTCGK